LTHLSSAVFEAIHSDVVSVSSVTHFAADVLAVTQAASLAALRAAALSAASLSAAALTLAALS
jgi:hypothetical protein